MRRNAATARGSPALDKGTDGGPHRHAATTASTGGGAEGFHDISPGGGTGGG